MRLGILDNTRWNTNKLLRHLRAELEQAHTLKAVSYYRKESFSRFAEPLLISRIRAENDIVVTAIGDRGSCTSCCMHDAMSLESLGVPSAVIALGAAAQVKAVWAGSQADP